MNKIIILSVSTLLAVPVFAQSAQDISTLGCMLEPSETIEVSSPVTSVIEKIEVKRGQKNNKRSITV